MDFLLTIAKTVITILITITKTPVSLRTRGRKKPSYLYHKSGIKTKADDTETKRSLLAMQHKK